MCLTAMHAGIVTQPPLGLINGVVFIDLKKAFDTIDHQIILQKLKNYGIDENSLTWFHSYLTFSYPEPFLRAVNGARQGALAKSISNWHLIGYNEGYCSNNVYILLPCFYGIRFWIWPEPLVAPRVRRALGTRMLNTLVWSGHVTRGFCVKWRIVY